MQQFNSRHPTKDYVWICAGVQVLDGVKVERKSVIAAGPVVIRDVDPYSMVAGAPAKLLGTLKKYLCPEAEVVAFEPNEHIFGFPT